MKSRKTTSERVSVTVEDDFGGETLTFEIHINNSLWDFIPALFVKKNLLDKEIQRWSLIHKQSGKVFGEKDTLLSVSNQEIL